MATWPTSFSRLSRTGAKTPTGSFENRIRFALETARAVRKQWPDRFPLAARLSCTDWADGGWTLEDSIALASHLKDEGVDLIDCSSGGLVPGVTIPVGAGYQAPFAEAIRHRTGILTAAVGMIQEPMRADDLVRNGRADLVLLAREELRDPYWPLHAAVKLHKRDQAQPPAQYGRAF